ncbi:MAG TPA: M48 family metallopeptidase [Bacteroidales bacterium]|jgi:STE24 endopeptidase|nr:M48 family metallopeptidase [Bacteroidales bacterium]HOX75496.1 M48 family metallopeptidase [Bacteroidales bacterium]HPM87608.1 M48 family metallopeptidase [Bacteroidales bacterium]
MYNTIFFLIIIIPVAGFVLEQYLIYLNRSMWSETLPEKLKGVCPEEDYRKSQLYDRDNVKLAFWSSSINLAVILIMIVAGGFSLADDLARSMSSNLVIIALIFFIIIGLASEIINIPFSWYDTFVIEKKYGFNTMTTRTFITDMIKSWFIALIIGVPVLAVLTWFYYKAGASFWFYAWGLVTVFSVFLNFFYSELIVPLFNKQTPLPEGTLRDRIEDFAVKTGFRLKNIYIIDGSRRSTKSNAYFSGFGKKKRIVLYDTLLKEFTEEEIVAVLAHEIGHYKKKHVLINLLFSVMLTGFMLFLFSLVVDNPALSQALGAKESSFHLGLVVFGILYSPLSLLIGLITNIISRENEFAADQFVKENYNGKNLGDALKKLSVKNLSNMMPHPLYVFFHYSHPPLLQRLEKLE